MSARLSLCYYLQNMLFFINSNIWAFVCQDILLKSSPEKTSEPLSIYNVCLTPFSTSNPL